MKIVSWNVNGLRAVYKRNFLEWLEESKIDIVCLQETKIQEGQIPFDLIYPQNYFSYFNSAQKKGYSGVAVYSKRKPVIVEKKIGFSRFDDEGRILQLKYTNFTLINLYLPHGGRQKENLGYKLEVYDYLLTSFRKVREKQLILIGDFNIARSELDLARPKENFNNIMFTSQERKRIDQLIALGFVDTFRKFHQENGNYTWWPYYANARQRNLGWRIDYVFTSKSLSPRVKDAFILKEVLGSDHCPVGVEIRVT